MAINDNETYGLLGSQVKDLASRINTKGNVYHIAAPYELAVGSDNLKNLCAFINESLAGKNCVLTITKAQSNDPAYDHVVGGIVNQVSTNYVKFSFGREFLADANSTTAYGVSYFGTAAIEFFVYAPKSEYNNNNIQNLYSNTALTSRYIAFQHTSGTGRSLVPLNSILGMNNNTAWTPTGDYNPSTKKYVDDKVITGSAAPTTSTVGIVGQIYQDSTNGKAYICTAIIPGTAPDPDTYTWEEMKNSESETFAITIGGTTTRDINTATAALQETLVKIANSTLSKNTFVHFNAGLYYNIPFSKAQIYSSGSTYRFSFTCQNVDMQDTKTSYGVTYYRTRPYTWTFYLLPSEVTAGKITHVYATYAGSNPDDASSYSDGSISPTAANGKWWSDATGVLATTNTTAYTPTGDYNPATKKYVDDNMPVFTMTTTDPGEGSALAANHFIGVYEV